MAGLVALSTDEKRYEGHFGSDLFYMTFYQQHLGESWCGLALSDKKAMSVYNRKGYVRTTLGNGDEPFWQAQKGWEGIGYCGHAKEPFYSDTQTAEIALAFTGNITNSEEIKQNLKERGHNFIRGDEAEIITKLLGQNSDIKISFANILYHIHGAFSLVLVTNEGIYAFSSGHWPLVIGEKGGAKVVTTSSAGFYNLDYKLIDEVEPGELIHISQGEILFKNKVVAAANTKESWICSFMWVYTAFPNDVFRGVPASAVRKELGRKLAKKDIKAGKTPDIVVPITDSGRFHAIGYHQEWVDQANNGEVQAIPYYEEALLKYPYAGRSFTPQNQKAREREAKIKLNPSSEDFAGKRAVIVDDSIVRGTQLRTNLVPKLRHMNVEQIWLRIGNPELRSACPWGKTTKKGETLAGQKPSFEERRKYLGVEDLMYNSTNELYEVLSSLIEHKTSLCMDCSLNTDLN